MYDLDYIFNAIKYGTDDIVSDEELKLLILKKKKIIVKVGFDPTTNNLHLGHCVILNKLKQLQDFGYGINIIIGDFTAMIGDPSGRNLSRKILTKEEIIFNYKTYNTQIFKILNPAFTKIYFNSSWFNFFGLDNLLKLMSCSTVSRILERSDFKIRNLSNKSINFNEFVYPFLQGFDSIFLESDIEIGGTDQKFNFLLSRDLQKRYNQKPQISIMMPILIGIDGKKKMSKSLGNCINFDDDNYNMFCKIMSIPDFLIKDYFLNLLSFNQDQYIEICLKYKNPMYLKMELAYRIVTLLHSNILADKAKTDFLNFVSKKNLPSDFLDTEIFIESNNIFLSDILIKIKFLTSNSDFKRHLKLGSIRVDGIQITDKNCILSVNKFYFLQFGKKKMMKIFLKKKIKTY